MPQPAPTSYTPAHTEEVVALLADAYDLPAAELQRVPAGQVTINYRAEVRERTVFVKQYTDEADLAAESAAIAQTRLAGEHGVPVAPLIPTAAGEAISRRGDTALSVWQWVSGRTVETGLTQDQQSAAGRTLGRIHRAFADHPAGNTPSPRLERWRNPDLTKLEATIDTLEKVIGQRTERDRFDEDAECTLAERRTMLHQVPDLLEALPPLSCQVLHGDYSAVNLLFDGEDLTAVLDFRPPEPFLAAFEVGRIAFDPRSVALAENWIAAGTALVATYLEENPHLLKADVTACARIALIQLVVSLYGVKQHYLAPGLLQNDLDAFWLLRHRAAQRLLHQLEEVEAALAAIAGRAATTAKQ